MIFRKKILGTLIKEVNGGRLQYTIHSFDEVADEINKLETVVKDLLSPVLHKSDITGIGSIPNGKIRHNLNFAEATIADVTNIIGQNGYCSISSEYISKRVENLLTEQYNKGCMSMQSEVDSLNRQLTAAVAKQKDLQSTIDELESSKPRRTANNNNTVDIEHQHHERHSERSNFIRFVHLALTLLCLLSLGYLIWIEKTEIEKKEIVTVDGEICSAASSNLFESDPQVPSGEIIVEGYDETEGLHENNEYKVTVKNFEGYSNIKLISDGKCDIINRDDSFIIKITEREGTITLACVEEDNQSLPLQKVQLIIKP